MRVHRRPLPLLLGEGELTRQEVNEGDQRPRLGQPRLVALGVKDRDRPVGLPEGLFRPPLRIGEHPHGEGQQQRVRLERRVA